MLVVRYSGKDPASDYMAAFSNKCDRKLCESDCHLKHVVIDLYTFMLVVPPTTWLPSATSEIVSCRKVIVT